MHIISTSIFRLFLFAVLTNTKMQKCFYFKFDRDKLFCDGET